MPVPRIQTTTAGTYELTRLAPVTRDGGLVPGIDHSVLADVSWDHYRRYLKLLIEATRL